MLPSHPDPAKPDWFLQILQFDRSRRRLAYIVAFARLQNHGCLLGHAVLENFPNISDRNAKLGAGLSGLNFDRTSERAIVPLLRSEILHDILDLDLIGNVAGPFDLETNIHV